MAESPEKRPPMFGFSPGGYLPRLWKSEPEPSEDPEQVPGRKKKKGKANDLKVKGGGKKGKPSDKDGEPGKKGVLLEETPHLDTIETRRTVRIVVGSVLAMLLLTVGFVAFRMLFGSSGEEEPFNLEPIAVEDPRAARERHEIEANAMMERAREVSRRGNNELALSLLTRLSSAYPETKAASRARDVLSRPRQSKQPLFSETPDVAVPVAVANASTSTKPATPSPAPKDDPRTSSGLAPNPVEKGQASTTARPAESPQSPANLDPALAANRVPAVVTPTTVDPTVTPTPTATPTSNPLPAGFQPSAGAGIHPSGWPLEIFGGREGARMVLVPGGTFIMGRDGGDVTEGPAHQVKVSTFYIDKHEVTNRQFDRFVKETGPRVDRARVLAREGGAVSLSEDSPVVMVNAKDASDYAEWAGKRLPTEAQWEMAARGTDNRLYPWGHLPPNWERRREPRQIDPVMSFPTDTSPFGVYDMAGNALEWTRDWYDPGYYASLAGTIADDPIGAAAPSISTQMTIKGGSKQWIVTARQGNNADVRLPYLGFRCTLPVEGQSNAFQPQPVAAPVPQPLRSTPTAPRTAPRKKVFVPF